jgi:predicted flap endonuclease-1-like 5' DNA nuclease
VGSVSDAGDDPAGRGNAHTLPATLGDDMMKAICTDGTEIECEKFKSVEGGVVLTADRKRKKVVGFVPNATLAYVLPDDIEPVRHQTATSDAETDAVAAEVAVVDEAADAGEAVDLATVGEGEAPDADDPGGDDAADDPGAGLVSGAPDATTVDPGEDPRRLAGLGDTYAGRLRAAGIETLSDLRASSVDEVAEAARVPRGRAERWLRLVTPREDEAGDGVETGSSDPA